MKLVMCFKCKKNFSGWHTDLIFVQEKNKFLFICFPCKKERLMNVSEQQTTLKMEAFNGK